MDIYPDANTDDDENDRAGSVFINGALFIPAAPHPPEAGHGKKAKPDDQVTTVEAALTGTPSDPLLSSQWHLSGEYGINVETVWNSYTGAGIRVALIDDGFEYTHPDLAANYDTASDYDALGNDNDAMAETGNWHGTSTAGVIVADDNGDGAVGVAFDATMTGIRIGFGANWSVTQIESALAHALTSHADVLSNSWGFLGAFSDNFKSAYFATVESRIQDLAAFGRDGLGTSIVFAGRNDRADGGSSNYHNVTNSPYTITVSATDSAGLHTSFSSPGASILVAAPGQDIVTTDRVGLSGYGPDDYISAYGTSLSTPMVAGIIALMYQANGDLGYRDVQEILAYSARMTDPGSAGWRDNGAQNWNGGGLHFNHDYGYGLVDALAAVNLAETWTLQQTYATMTQTVPVSGKTWITLPETGAVTTTIDIADAVEIERVLVDITINHTHSGDLTIRLISPQGTESVLADRIDNGSYGGLFSFTFGSVAHWGENSAGPWTLMIEDSVAGGSGDLAGWNLAFTGNTQSADDVFVYTDEFAGMSGTRAVLSDTDGGIDTINLAAVSIGDTVLDLRPGTSSLVAGSTLTVASGALIENAFTGYGNDTVTGNDADNTIGGGRGDDILYGGLGSDTYIYNAGNGADLIRDIGGDADGLRFGAGIIYSALVLTQAAYDLIIDTDGSGANTITVLGHYLEDGLSALEKLLFDDGSTIDLPTPSGPPVNQSPTALDDFFTSQENASLTGNVLADNGGGPDYDADGDSLSVAAESIGTTAGGTVSLNADGNFLYTPLNGFWGTDSFDYTLLDGRSGSDTGTVTLQVEELVDPAIYGTSAGDTIHGTANADIIRGLGGNDTLYGDGGNDVLYGGAGADSLYGGNGADIFAFESATAYSGVDALKDFKTRQGDAIDISDLLTAFDPLSDALSDFVRIARSGKDGALQIDPDGGTDTFTSIAIITGGRALITQDLLDQGHLIV